MSDQSRRFYEVEKRVEELERMLITHRRSTVFTLACLHVVSLTIALWVVRWSEKEKGRGFYSASLFLPLFD